MTAMRPPKEEELHGVKRFLATFPVMLVTFIGILPQIVVIVSSFIKSDFTGFKKGFSLGSYITIFNRLWTNIRNTFVFSTIAIIVIIIIGASGFKTLISLNIILNPDCLSLFILYHLDFF